MKDGIKDIIINALSEASAEGLLTIPPATSAWPDITVERPRKEEFGDFSTNIAMLLAKAENRAPREIASTLVVKIAAAGEVKRCEVAGPGFINIYMEKSYWLSILGSILEKGARYGNSEAGKGLKVQVEYVSANPTGPLHIGHGRGAAVGDSLANILTAVGYDVTREFYINDAGKQVHNLGESVRLRIEELKGGSVELGEEHYRGEYVKEIAEEYTKMLNAREGAGPVALPQDFASDIMLGRIKDDLKDFGIEFDRWFSEEKDLHSKGRITDIIKELREKGFVEDRDDATWFLTKQFGDDKDRVLIKSDGQLTYLAADLAYHKNKIERGFDTLVNVWGYDHHGYEARVRALFKALGKDDSMLRIIFIQLVTLLRGGVPVTMGKRAGEFVTLRQVMDEVGADVCRFFFLMRKSDAQLDFDLDLAKSQASENPVYYVQYCYARIKSIFAFADESGVRFPKTAELPKLEENFAEDELAVIRHLGLFEEVVEKSASEMAPHKVTFYLMDLAGIFHPYYKRNRVVTDDEGTTKARLLVCKAVETVMGNGLRLLGIKAPEKM
jgi:arginyl-tRNA synthetase